MRLFFDTEFTDLARPDLISIGFISEDGQHSFYAVLTDYNHQTCSRFVLETVIPLLPLGPAEYLTLPELRVRVVHFLQGVARKVELCCDSPIDLRLLKALLGTNMPANVGDGYFDLATLAVFPVYHHAVDRYQDRGGARHNAYHDAAAHRAGWLAWNDKKRRNRLGL